MLLSPLLLMLAACSVQDAPTDPASPGAAPSETPENVRAYLKEAQGQLYDPQAAGLATLAFDLPVEAAMIGKLGTVHVTWSAGQEAQSEFTPNPDFKLPAMVPAESFPPEAMEAQSIFQAQQFLGSMLNRSVSSLLDTGVATMGGVQDGLVAVEHSIPGGTPTGGTAKVTYFFDEESRLKRSYTVLEGAGPMGSDVKLNQSFSWKPAVAGGEKLVAEAQAIEADFGMMSQTSNVSFAYQQVGEIVLPIEIVTVAKLPPQMGGEQRQVLTAQNLVVNGQAAPAPAPAATPGDAEPAPAPRAPEGG